MNIKKENIVCPHCGKSNTWIPSNNDRPFCSERCKLIDLGEWADEKYRIPIQSDSSEDNISDPEDDNT